MIIEVARLTETDVNEAVSVTVEAMVDSYERCEKDYYPQEAHEFDLRQNDRESFLGDLEGEFAFQFVAKADGRVVGVARGQRQSSFYMLRWICVHPKWQRKGVGEKLLGSVIEESRREGCHKLSLNTLPVLVPAINLYEKVGFVQEAVLKKQWWKVDFIFMSMWLE